MQLSKGRGRGYKLRAESMEGIESHTIPGGGCIERRGSMAEPCRLRPAAIQHFKIWGTRRNWQRSNQEAGGEPGKRRAREN